MKRIQRILFFAAIGFIAVCAAKPAEAQAKNLYLSKKTVPDKLLRSQLKKYDKNKNGILEKNERKKIKEMKLKKKKKSINVKGLSACTNLQKLTIDTGGKVKNTKEISKLKNLKTYHVTNANTTFDVSKNKKLEKLVLEGMTGLKSIKLEKNKSLKTFYVSCCHKAKKVCIKGNKKLKDIQVEDNDKIKEVIITDNKKLRNVVISGGEKFEKARIIGNQEISNLRLYSCKLKMVELDKMNKLKDFSITSSLMNKIVWENMPNLKVLYYHNKGIMLPDFYKITKLEKLYLPQSEIKELDISMLPAIRLISCRNGKIRALKVAPSNRINTIDLENNQLTGVWDLNKYPYLGTFSCDNNKVEKIIAVGHPTLSTLSCQNNDIQEVNTYGVNLLCFYAKGNPNAKIFLMKYPGGDERYSYDETAKVTYQFG